MCIRDSSTVEKEYIKKCLKLYKELDAKIACVGGTIVSESLSGSDEAVSQVLSSPFGVGNSKFRYSTEAGFVDTVAFGMYKNCLLYTSEEERRRYALLL